MLKDLLSGALLDAEERRSARPLARVEQAALERAPALDASAALAPAPSVHIIAEVKRSSPSRGTLAAIPDPASLALSYEQGGASAVSVLTEQRRFGGSLQDLEAVREAIRLPLLRKDFIGEEYQILEARAAGADLVLLIVAALDRPTLARLYSFIGELGMTPLVEAHSVDEVEAAADLGAGIIGVNARDLSTFELDRELFGRLAARIPEGTIKVAESAVVDAGDVAHYRAAGADAVLVGEALVTGGDPAGAVRAFREV